MIVSTRWLATFLFIISTAGCHPPGGTSGEKPGGTSGGTPCVALPGAASGGASCLAPTDLDDNGLHHNGLHHNSLSRDVLGNPAVQSLLQGIARGPLNTDRVRPFQPLIRDNENVQSLMEYVVSCALDKDVSVDPGVPVETASGKWYGELGLCGARSPFGSGAPSPFGNWVDHAPSTACLEIVSSCVLARVNALQRKVLISMRGEPGCLFPLQSKVPVEEAYRYNGDNNIKSFAPCVGGTPDEDPTRDCGWKGGSVGSCTPDGDVTLTTSPGAKLRVCKGIYGCDHRDTPAPPAGTSEYHTPLYAGVIEPIDASSDRVTFKCPRNGASAGARSSYFSVMMAPRAPTGALPVVTAAEPAKYPSLEEEVFTYREGAFFGNIFLGKPDPQLSGKMLVGDQYACYSDVWDNGIAALTDRLCAGPDPRPGVRCFDNLPRPCLWQLHRPGELAPDSNCGAQFCAPQQTYLNCSKDSRSPRRPTITVFLNHPCDLVRDIDSCRVAYSKAFSSNNWHRQEPNQKL